MKSRALNPEELVVTSFETAPADTFAAGNPTPDSGCFDCPNLVTISCDHPCF
ncbi:MAG TPA: hypothetical protein VFJ16_26705 [Longimicrobium sp.]|nr:hypothetical protein [Longimicrobium sp.]